MATANQEIRDLRAELEELRASISSGLRNGRAREQLHHLAEDVREDARDIARNAGASLRQAWSRSRHAAEDAYHNYEASVSRHPISATAIAFAGGVLFAALMRRR
jgi:ElaB/YqjD/DUF883 family membrane-anchored ribosome-binding protein